MKFHLQGKYNPFQSPTSTWSRECISYALLRTCSLCCSRVDIYAPLILFPLPAVAHTYPRTPSSCGLYTYTHVHKADKGLFLTATMPMDVQGMPLPSSRPVLPPSDQKRNRTYPSAHSKISTVREGRRHGPHACYPAHSRRVESSNHTSATTFVFLSCRTMYAKHT